MKKTDVTGSDLLLNAAMQGAISILDSSSIRDLSPDILDDSGKLRIMPSSYYADTTCDERALFGLRHGAYLLPTHELIEYLRERIAGRSAIEIGAGNGVVAAALGIRATDSMQQAQPSVAKAYQVAGQATVRYGDNVEALDALSAVQKYRPQVVLGCWVTHRFDSTYFTRGGNMDGVDEHALLNQCDEYLFVGSRKAHRRKPILSVSHRIETPLGLYSRSSTPNQDFVAIWDGVKRVT